MKEKTCEEEYKEKILRKMRRKHRDRYIRTFGSAIGKEELVGITWESNIANFAEPSLTLAEVIAGAEKEFPNVSFDRLYLTGGDIRLETEEYFKHYVGYWPGVGY